MPGGGGGWDDPQTMKISGSNYASQDEMRASIDLVRRQYDLLKHDLKVSENGYLALYREHERDLVILKRRVWGLAAGNVLLALGVLRLAWVV